MMQWLVDNWETIFAVWGMLVTFCTAVVKLTPTTKDDKILAWVVKWADVFSIVFTKKDAETIAKALEKSKK